MRAIHFLLLSITHGLFALPPINLPPIDLPILEPIRSTSDCLGEHGNPPAELSTSLLNILSILNICANITGYVETLSFTDSDGNHRLACLLITSTTSPSPKPLPLLVWLHPAIFPSTTILLTDLLIQSKIANLTGTPDGPLGYHLLLPFGRNITHIYPIPADQGLGWDNWYRNYNRSDPALNVDVQTIDYFINQVVNTTSNFFRIDKSRIFMSGWSNGAAMAAQYALNTPGIAAAAVYSAPDPYRDYHDPCTQEPYPTHFTPVLILYNQCDIIDICRTGKNFIIDLKTRYKELLTAEYYIFDLFFKQTDTCDSQCDGISILGFLRHITWPTPLTNNVLLDFLRKHPLGSP